MTLMLASVVDAVEARLAFDGGADAVDFSDPRGGALGAVAAEAIAPAVSATGEGRAISAALGPPPYDAETLASQARTLFAAGVGVLRLAADVDSLDRLKAALSGLAQDIGLVGVLLADQNPDFRALERMAALGFRAALLDAAEEDGKRLLDHLPPARIEAFCRRCRELGLAAWLAGSLQSPDVPRLMIVEPDVLGFRSALRLRGRHDGPLDPRRIALIRDLIPRDPARWSGEGSGVNSADRPSRQDPSRDGRRAGVSDLGRLAPSDARPLPRSPSTSIAGAGKAALDTIFVHDFLTTAEIGAYAHERGTRQRLLFNIDAAVSRVAAQVYDMRAIVSYDVILDAVRIVLGRGHVDFIETVAEDVAAIVLKHPRVREVRVRVEKLDVMAGSVGVEIVRGREE